MTMFKVISTTGRALNTEFGSIGTKLEHAIQVSEEELKTLIKRFGHHSLKAAELNADNSVRNTEVDLAKLVPPGKPAA